MRGRRIRLIAALGLCVCYETRAGVLEFHDKGAWINAVVSFTTIGFDGFPSGTYCYRPMGRPWCRVR